jgi:HD-GYP domain-containing protein (c-di-GMP phosphodiesterase class II)
MAVKKIRSGDVEIGMFISSLDRPWLETPFLFQGFTVRDSKEIETLQSLCRDVYIMMPDEEIELSGGSNRTSIGPEYAELVGRKQYQVTQPPEEALREARPSHEKISCLVQDIEKALREDQEVDVQLIKRSVDVMVDSIERNPDAYIWLTRIKKYDSYIYKDSLSASVWATTLGRELGLEREKLNALATGVMFMDIGKTALPASLLSKVGRLSDDEWELMKSHVQLGIDILSDSWDVSPDVLEIVRTHHERVDGSGYPGNLSGNRIPLLGQIAGVVDFYTAVTSTRPYAKAVSPSTATYMLYQQQGRLFSEQIVQKFIYSLSTYPTGSLVELSSGEVALVISQNPGLRLKPNVVLLLDPDKRSYGSYPVINLADPTHGHLGNPLTIKTTLADGEYGIRMEELSF